MEFQNLQAIDYVTIRSLCTNPFSNVHCPRCGSRLRFVVKTKSIDLGNIYNIECSRTRRCFYYPIPPLLTPACLKWLEPNQITVSLWKSLDIRNEGHPPTLLVKDPSKEIYHKGKEDSIQMSKLNFFLVDHSNGVLRGDGKPGLHVLTNCGIL